VRKAALGALLALFAFLHLSRMGAVGFTWDEGGDLTTVQCLRDTHDPFACLADISQTRLPFYLHALIPGSPFLLSFAFSLVTLLAVYVYARREYGWLVATLFAALYVTSPGLLASGRMVLTHSSVMFVCFTTLSMLALFRGRMVWCAILTGLAAACSILAALNLVFLGAFYLLKCRKRWRDLLFIPISAVTFFATTIIYLSPANFRALLNACLHPNLYPFWNYLGLGTNRAPWFFPFLLLAVKIGPWLVFLLHREARWFAAALLVHLVAKGAVFHYDTPHHQVQLYPLLYLFVAIGIARWWRPWVIAIVTVLFAVQLFDVFRFYPNYLFYGAQYGDLVIGEFYGPAVIHGQDRYPIWRFIDSMPETTFLMADNNALDRFGPRFVPFTKRDPKVVYEYALVDRLYAKHFAFPERDAYNAYLARYYEPVFTTEFPPGVWVYRVMRLRGQEAAAHATE
jgi:hypothetical protein